MSNEDLGVKVLYLLKQECPRALTGEDPEEIARALNALSDNLASLFVLVQRKCGNEKTAELVNTYTRRIAKFYDSIQAEADDIIAARKAQH